MSSAMLKKPNLTEGPIFSRIILVALPLMASNLLQALYNSADMIIVGLSPVKDAVGAIGVSTSLLHLLVNLFIGLSVGTNVVVARHIGEGDENKVSAAIHTSVVMSFIFGGAFGILGFFISKPMLIFMGAEGELLELANIYSQIYFIGAPFLALTNYLSSVYRAKGDTKTPLIVLSLSGLFNVLLNLFFVLAVGLSVEGVAIATVLSNVASAAVLIIILMKDKGFCHFSIKKLRLDKREFFDILYIGVPVGIQSTLFSISNTIIQSSILEVNNLMCPEGSSYQAVIQGNAAASNIENLVFAAANSIPQAIVSFVGQNLGAKKYERVTKITIYGFIISALTSAIFSITVFLLKNPLLYLYGVTDTPDLLGQLAFSTATKRFVFHLAPFIFFGIMDMASNIAKAMKKAITSTAITLVGTCIFRIIWILTVFRAFLNLESIFISYPISWILTGIVEILLVIFTIKSEKKKQSDTADTDTAERP